MNRRTFCFSLLAIPRLAALAEGASPIMADSSGRIRFVLEDPLEHPFYWWPRTLLHYPVKFAAPVTLEKLKLVDAETGKRTLVQFSAVERCALGVRSATVHFFSDLPSGGRREYLLGQHAQVKISKSHSPARSGADVKP
ncbi:MAG TPA: hypothetical protein VFW30_14195 [Bryocella sp.]|nr:hypothetical protein [Bryocella sp.]